MGSLGPEATDSGKGQKIAASAEIDQDRLMECCAETIEMHGENNPMMVCSSCKQIIKCFSEEKAFRNYQRFCDSRHRRILATNFASWWVVVFKSYDTFSS